jgi:hypothetical protein
MTEELDDPDDFIPLGLKTRLTRAADWRSRTMVPTPAIPRPPDRLPLLILPPELMGIGRVASAVASQLGSPIWLAPADVRLGVPPTATLVWLTPSDLVTLSAPLRPSLTFDDVAPFAPLPMTASPDDHPVAVLAHFLHAVSLAHAQTPPVTLPAALAHRLDQCGLEIPTGDNPAKQVALRLHERIPIFCADAIDTGIAKDWAMRLHWLAETAAWQVDGPTLARSAVLARLPRYWPNTACFVTFQEDDVTDARTLVAATLDLLRRRRFAVYSIAVPAGLDPLQRAGYLLELGEWVALYAALLNNSELGARVPHTILFAP